MSIRYLLATAVASLALMASAQVSSDPMYMVLTMKDGSFKAVNIDEIKRLTYDNGKINVEKKNASAETFSISDISNMEFSNTESSGLVKVEANESPISYNRSSNTLTINGVSGGQLSIYNATGATILSHKTIEGVQALDIASLQEGVYVITYNGQSFKIKK